DEITQDPSTHRATFIPVILGSDKTTVSVVTGQNDYWPIYISIRNIHNNVWHAHHNGVDLLAFLAIPKGTSPLHSITCLFIGLLSSKEICR
ncbi:hypothetical protein EDD17DRAFT_1482304, partial [Pisolithus thermaeus]